jgi:hypothetical protein
LIPQCDHWHRNSSFLFQVCGASVALALQQAGQQHHDHDHDVTVSKSASSNPCHHDNFQPGTVLELNASALAAMVQVKVPDGELEL